MTTPSGFPQWADEEFESLVDEWLYANQHKKEIDNLHKLAVEIGKGEWNNKGALPRTPKAIGEKIFCCSNFIKLMHLFLAKHESFTVSKFYQLDKRVKNDIKNLYNKKTTIVPQHLYEKFELAASFKFVKPPTEFSNILGLLPELSHAINSEAKPEMFKELSEPGYVRNRADLVPQKRVNDSEASSKVLDSTTPNPFSNLEVSDEDGPDKLIKALSNGVNNLVEFVPEGSISDSSNSKVINVPPESTWKTDSKLSFSELDPERFKTLRSEVNSKESAQAKGSYSKPTLIEKSKPVQSKKLKTEVLPAYETLKPRPTCASLLRWQPTLITDPCCQPTTSTLGLYPPPVLARNNLEPTNQPTAPFVPIKEPLKYIFNHEYTVGSNIGAIYSKPKPKPKPKPRTINPNFDTIVFKAKEPNVNSTNPAQPNPNFPTAIFQSHPPHLRPVLPIPADVPSSEQSYQFPTGSNLVNGLNPLTPATSELASLPTDTLHPNSQPTFEFAANLEHQRELLNQDLLLHKEFIKQQLNEYRESFQQDLDMHRTLMKQDLEEHKESLKSEIQESNQILHNEALLGFNHTLDMLFNYLKNNYQKRN